MKKLVTILCFFASSYSFSQEHPTASGGEATGTGGSVSYSIGEVDYINSTSTAGTITQGVQQPYEIVTTVGIAETNINLTTSVYPNPTAEFVTLKVENNKIENLSYEIFDVQGKLLQNKNLENPETAISMKEFANATYFIKVLNNNSEVKTFKIIKNK